MAPALDSLTVAATAPVTPTVCPIRICACSVAAHSSSAMAVVEKRQSFMLVLIEMFRSREIGVSVNCGNYVGMSILRSHVNHETRHVAAPLTAQAVRAP